MSNFVSRRRGKKGLFSGRRRTRGNDEFATRYTSDSQIQRDREADDAARFRGRDLQWQRASLPVVSLLPDLSGAATDAWKRQDKY